MDHTERFQVLIRDLPELTLETVQAALDAGSYWPAPWSLAKKRVHIRWMFSESRE